jgi:uncharacterized membrane protein YdjX (TVP38/TMEM64 family)
MKIKYPKLTLLLLTFVIAYVLFSWRNVLPFQSELLALGYPSAFILGMLFTYGFTAAPATVFLLMLAKDYNIFLFALIAGMGALTSDLLLFTFIRSSFMDEIKEMSNEKPVKKLRHMIHGHLKKYLLPVLAGFVIASPLPDEIGVCLLASSKISPRAFSVFSYVFNTLGILAILVIGNAVYV